MTASLAILLCCLCSGTIRLVSSARNMPFNLRWNAVQHTLRELVHFRSSGCFSCPPIHPHPCPRSPSPDTASTSALVQGQREGDKPRLRAQLQSRAQVPDADPIPVNHTWRTRLSLRRGLPLRFYFGTKLLVNSQSCLITLREDGRGSAAMSPALCTGHCRWGNLEPLGIDIAPQILACLLHRG